LIRREFTPCSDKRLEENRSTFAPYNSWYLASGSYQITLAYYVHSSPDSIGFEKLPVNIPILDLQITGDGQVNL
jgi:hypothetical protein